MLKTTLFITATLALASPAWAAATWADAFVGDVSIGWEGDWDEFPVCYDIEGGTVCSDTGAVDVTGGWSFTCGIDPYGDSQLMGNTADASIYTFDTPVTSFGGYWGSIDTLDTTTATFTFRNAAGDEVGTETLEITECGVWYWAGWTFSEGVTEITIEEYYLMSDDVQYSYGEGTGGSLTAVGSCPGVVDINADGLTPDGRFAMLFSRIGTGSDLVPSGPCAGTETGLAGVRYGFNNVVDATGGVSFSPDAPAGACGIHMQVLDVATCTLTNVAVLGEDGGGGGGGEYVGSYDVGDGPGWSEVGVVAVSCMGGCAENFGGVADDYQCSTNDVDIDNQGYYSGWGDGTYCTTPAAEDWVVGDVTDCGDFGCYYSAWVSDHCHGSINHCWTR